ncbi:MAG: 3-isopropylmalate dehydratase small subunit [Hyphomicrobiaceae bacterium]|nr:3-isopropylmalate dehydratase small subunit [Hyphomicrobiaceae bacterium]MCC0009256.1 3-isopropylmalate dehydratase small subunit [Hyphomicrobiaceae bacterium]
MEQFRSVTGSAAPLVAPNIDTDIIMPKTFLKGVDRKGLDIGVFNSLRFTDGKPNTEFVLNKPGYEDCKFLITGANFGCGSSREHAVWGLYQLGIRALIGSTFAGIFNDNCRNNGILTINLPHETISDLAECVTHPEHNELTVDLENQTIRINATGDEIPFEIEPARKQALLQGLDPVGATLQHVAEIRAFEQDYRIRNPWYF